MNTSVEAIFQSKSSAHTANALRFITCGSVDDGNSTRIGRLLVDSKAVLQDHLAGVQRSGETDLALLTDGLSAEREQGITIDVAYRYFSTEARKFIIGDAPGHEQYTRNMVTAASSADAAVVLVDATKLDWANPALPLLTQTRRHSLLLKLLRVPSIVFAVNKLDAVANPVLAFAHIQAALTAFAQAAGIHAVATVPVSALLGWNVVDAAPEQTGATAGWCGYAGPTLLEILEALPTTDSPADAPFAFPVQWVEKLTPALAAQLTALPVNGTSLGHVGAQASTGAEGATTASAATTASGVGRRMFWGRVAAGRIAQGTEVQVFPSGQKAFVAQVLDHARRATPIDAGTSAGIVLDREVDVSRGDWLLAAPVANTNVAADDDFGDTPTAVSPYPGQRELTTTVAWMDDEPLVAGRVYWALQGHRWVKAKVRRVVHKLDVNTLAEEDATQLDPNAIGHVELLLQEALPAVPYKQSRVMGALILVDTATHRTSGAVLVN
jgi:sulfate adenylyltransferase subunit 1